MQREKSDLESRVEEEQDEVEQLVTKQRHNISQLGNVQHQLAEANFKIEELDEEKQSMETKVREDNTMNDALPPPSPPSPISPPPFPPPFPPSPPPPPPLPALLSIETILWYHCIICRIK